MKKLVLKFGGTSVGTIEKIKKVANIIKKRFSKGNEVIVVVSAMSGVTDELKAKSDSISKNFDNKELDVLLSSGEQVSCSLLSGALIDLGVKARSWLGWQIPIVTNDNYTSSQIMKIKTDEILNFISKKGVAVIAGFQGISEESRITTLGRGGSDFTAALLAEALDAESCEIWTDVTGVYTTDPRITPAAHPLPELSFEEAAEMATFGAKVLHPATMEPALRKDIKVFVGSSKEPEKGGTWIVRDCEHEPPYRAITRRKEQVMVTVKTPKMMYAQGFLQQVFAIIAKHKLSVDLVTTSEISVSFTLDNPANSVAQRLNKETIAELETICDVKVEKGYDLVTVVGNNMQTAVGVSSKILAAVSDFNLRMICFGANPHNLSFLVNETDSDDVVRKLHTALFE